MKRDNLVIVGDRVEIQAIFVDEIEGHFTDVLRHRIVGVQEIERPDQRVPETVGHTPGVAALPHDDALDAQVQRCLTYPLGHFLHVLVIADENTEVRRLRRIGTQCPADTCLMKHLGIPDQTINVWFSKEIG